MMMIPLKNFFRRGKSRKDSDPRGSPLSSQVSVGSSKSSPRTKRRKSKRSATTTPVEDERLVVARAFLDTWNDHKMSEGSQFITADFVIEFKDFELEWEDYAREAQNVFDAMPDFSFRYKSITLRDDGVVVLDHLIPSGHHTAKPYAFGPCEPIEPKGTYVENSPETLYYHFRDGKICKQVVVAHGDMTGPPGIYTQLGGFPLM